jgi:hypothetical protein
VQESLAEIGNETLEPPADGGFVDVKDACDLKKCLAIKEVGGEQKTVVGRQGCEGSTDSMGDASEFCRS